MPLVFATLTPVPASFVSDRLRQRHGDLAWRIGFRDEWLYPAGAAEFQPTVEPAMAVRVLTYTGLLYEKLIDDGVLRHDGNSPPTFKAWLDRFSLNADILAEEGNRRAAHRNPRQVSPRHQSAAQRDLPRQIVTSAHGGGSASSRVYYCRMSKPNGRESIRLAVTDFGPIARAEVDLRPLTVFIGPSNTGKSYLAILIYALHSLFPIDRFSRSRLRNIRWQDAIPTEDAVKRLAESIFDFFIKFHRSGPA